MGSSGGNVFGADRLNELTSYNSPMPSDPAITPPMIPGGGGLISDMTSGFSGGVMPPPSLDGGINTTPIQSQNIVPPQNQTPTPPSGVVSGMVGRTPGMPIGGGSTGAKTSTYTPGLVGGMTGRGIARMPIRSSPIQTPSFMTPPATTPTPVTPTPTPPTGVPGGLPGETLEQKRARIQKNRDAKRARGEIT